MIEFHNFTKGVTMSSILRNRSITTELQLSIKYMENVNEYADELTSLSKTWENLEFLSQFGNTKTNLSYTKSQFSALTSKLLGHLAQETLNKTARQMQMKSQVAIDVLIRNLYERTADIGFLATDDTLREFVINTKSKYDENFENYSKNIKNHIREYVAKYSVYFDVVLMNTKGTILMNLDDSHNLTQSKDSIIDLVVNTQEDFIESYKHHDFTPAYNKTLVYAYKVTQTNDKNSPVIAVLALCFRFSDEMRGIYKNLVSKENKECLTLLDRSGTVISSSDIYHIPVGATLELVLDVPYKIVSFGGRDYLAKTSITNGYQGFKGMGWYGHIMIPLEHAFKLEEAKDIGIDEEMILAILQNGKDFTNDLKMIPKEANFIQEDLNRALWNGNIAQSKTDNANKDFTRLLFSEVGRIGALTKDVFSKSISNLTQMMILNNTTSISSLMIDIMDRNLYERANDCRWWALTKEFREILTSSEISTEQKTRMGDILSYINNLYTVYTNLFIYDRNGIIQAVSDKSQTHLVGKKVSNEWVDETLRLKNTSYYCVSSFEPTQFYGGESTYIYNALIKEYEGDKAVGGIGIVFNSTKEFFDILNDSLPKNSSQESFAVFTSREKKIISSTNEALNIGEYLQLEDKFFALKNGESYSQIVTFDDKYYAIGVTCSKGYREYKSSSDKYKNDVFAFYFSYISQANLPIAKTVNGFKIESLATTTDTAEIGSFYVGEKWLGVHTSDIVETVSVKQLEHSIDLDQNSIFKGTVIYKDNAVSVLDIKSLIHEYNDEAYSDIVIIKYKNAVQKHYVGILVNRLGNINEVDSNKIKPIENHFISGGTLIQSIVILDNQEENKKLLTILNLEKLSDTFIS